MQQHRIKQMRKQFNKIKARIRNGHAKTTDFVQIREIDAKLSQLLPQWRGNFK